MDPPRALMRTNEKSNLPKVVNLLICKKYFFCVLVHLLAIVYQKIFLLFGLNDGSMCQLLFFSSGDKWKTGEKVTALIEATRAKLMADS